jgi:hypothetical protein
MPYKKCCTSNTNILAKYHVGREERKKRGGGTPKALRMEA